MPLSMNMAKFASHCGFRLAMSTCESKVASACGCDAVEHGRKIVGQHD